MAKKKATKFYGFKNVDTVDPKWWLQLQSADEAHQKELVLAVRYIHRDECSSTYYQTLGFTEEHRIKVNLLLRLLKAARDLHVPCVDIDDLDALIEELGGFDKIGDFLTKEALEAHYKHECNCEYRQSVLDQDEELEDKSPDDNSELDYDDDWFNDLDEADLVLTRS